MQQIKTILVPTDFSVPADYALYYAVELAKVYNSSIILYHSFIPFESGFYPIAQSSKENQENENNLIARLTQIKDEILKSNKDCPISVKVTRGPESLKLLEFCDQNNVDLVVMGTTGASGLREVAIGSFTASTMITAPCPVLAIPKGCKFEIPKKIIFASNYNPDDSKAIDFLLKWNEPFNAEINILHVDGKDNSVVLNEERFMAYNQAIKSQFKDYHLTFEHIEGDNISKTLIETALNNKADILCILPIKNRNFWNNLFHKSITKTTASHIHIPLLSIPTD